MFYLVVRVQYVILLFLPKLLTVLQLIRFVIISAYLPYNLISLIMS